MAGRVNVLMQVEGGEQLRRALSRKAEEVSRLMQEQLPREAEGLLREANGLAPRASGELAGSAQASSAVTRKGTQVRAAAAYTDEKAAAVHEGIHWNTRIEGTRGFKWFQRAFDTWKPGAVDRLVARLRKLVGG